MSEVKAENTEIKIEANVETTNVEIYCSECDRVDLMHHCEWCRGDFCTDCAHEHLSAVNCQGCHDDICHGMMETPDLCFWCWSQFGLTIVKKHSEGLINAALASGDRDVLLDTVKVSLAANRLSKTVDEYVESCKHI